jgi:hypothetical protein
MSIIGFARVSTQEDQDLRAARSSKRAAFFFGAFRVANLPLDQDLIKNDQKLITPALLWPLAT